MPELSPESHWIRLAVAGDRASLAQLLLVHYDALRRHVAGRIHGDLEGALSPEDVLQQTFVRAARRIGTFQCRHEGAFRAWLMAIADNLIKDAAKRRRRERRAPAHPSGDQTGERSTRLAALEGLAGDVTTPGRWAERREAARRLQAAVMALPDDQREVIQRYYLEDQSLEQIAEAMGRSRDAVRGLCFRARKNLRALMGGSSLYFSG